jgi:hypothetical protein
VVGVAVGRVSAAVKASTEQGQVLTDALLGDLALEHELLDRTRLARMIAEHSKETKTLKVLDRLEDAHTATIDWLMTRLAEVAVGGPTGLRPTTMQSVVGVSRRATQFPVQQAAATLNRSADVVGRLRQRTVEAVATNVDRARELVDAAGDIWTAGRDATLKRTEEVAEQRGARLNGEKRQQRAARARFRRRVGTSDPRLRRAEFRYGYRPDRPSRRRR